MIFIHIWLKGLFKQIQFFICLPFFSAKKLDKKIRFYVNYQKLNIIINKDQYFIFFIKKNLA